MISKLFLMDFYFSLQAAEQIHDTTDLRKGVEEDVMNASHRVDEVWCTLVLQLRQHSNQKRTKMRFKRPMVKRECSVYKVERQNG